MNTSISFVYANLMLPKTPIFMSKLNCKSIFYYKRCSGISRKPRAKYAEAFKCKTCVKGAQDLNKSEAGCVELDDGSKFELVGVMDIKRI